LNRKGAEAQRVLSKAINRKSGKTQIVFHKKKSMRFIVD
jgi:hypothetical protein